MREGMPPAFMHACQSAQREGSQCGDHYIFMLFFCGFSWWCFVTSKNLMIQVCACVCVAHHPFIRPCEGVRVCFQCRAMLWGARFVRG